MPRRGNNLLKEDRKVERILCLWNILMRGRGVTREEIAAKLKVNERTVSRYFADIRGCLAALEESDGIHRRLIHSREEGVYKMINEGGEYLTSGELFAVCKILLSSKAFHKVEMKALLERLLQNLASSEERTEIDEYIKNELFEYAEPNHKNPDMDLLWKITRAIHQHHVIAFDYKKISAETSSPHAARPLGILFSEFYFYVAARPDRGIKTGATSPLKIYRLDRMTSVIDTEKTFEEPYIDRFREGEFKNRVQFMYSGKRSTLNSFTKASPWKLSSTGCPPRKRESATTAAGASALTSLAKAFSCGSSPKALTSTSSLRKASARNGSIPPEKSAKWGRANSRKRVVCKIPLKHQLRRDLF